MWLAFAVLGSLLLGYLGFLIFDVSARSSSWLNDWHIGLEAVASGLCLGRGLGGGSRRPVALALGAASLSWTLGDVLATLETQGGATPSTPSLSDAFYLGFYPLALVAILLFTRGELIKRSDAPNWLDGVIAALGMAALCAAFAFHGLEKLFQGPSLAAATSLAYPAGDLLLLGIIAGSAVVVTGRSRAIVVLIAIGLAIDSAGDTFSFVGDWSHIGPVVYGISWPAAILVFAMSMWVRDDGSEQFALEKVSGFVLPGVFACASLVILVGAGWHRFGPIAVGLAAITLVFTGVRLAFRPALYLARERLRSSEERYRLMFEQSPQPMMTYDRQTLQIVAVSDAMVADYGYSREELQSMTIKGLVPSEDADWLLAYLAADPNGSRPEFVARVSAYPGRHRRKDGTIIEVEVSGSNIDLDGRECRIAHLHDVTERNKAAAEVVVARDQAVEASNMKSAFLANVSHEIRTPMNGVIGMNELLLDMDLSDEQRECAEQVARSGQHALTIINDILDLSKIETGHLELDVADFDLHETIKETCSAAAAHARAKGLRLDLQIAGEVPLRARGDGRRLHQVLMNLLANAVKFTAAGAVSVRVTAAPRPQGSAWIRVEVADSGIGIEPASLARMFEPFTQADVSTTRIYGGTGLGLSIARELVELMGGTISGESEPGHGSTFSFELELAAPDTSDARPAHGAEATGAAPSWSSPPLVLIVEDSQINQIVAARALERCGCRAHVVGDGHEALQALQAHQFDAVLMDCQMPNMDGYEATGELRRRERDARHTPVIAMTAHAMDGDRQRCLDAGMDDYITKPMRHPDLADILRRWIPNQTCAVSQTGLGENRPGESSTVTAA